MTQHKVLSDDSMTAMDEIARVLGQDAVILSTKKIGQKIEIIGSNDIKDILKSSKKIKKNQTLKSFSQKLPYLKTSLTTILIPELKIIIMKNCQ
jgi:flagellar biosynthesis GTPase FlhF